MLLEFKNVTGKSKNSRKKPAGFFLKNISFLLEEGYILGIAGKNGAGKTTLFRYIMEPDILYDGQIFLDGEDIRKNRNRTMNKIGFVSDENVFFEMYTIAQNAELLGGFYEQWEQKKFEDMIKAMELGMGMKVGKLSRGQKIKFQLAFAVAHAPRLYLLDEPTAGMDPIFRKEFFRILQKIMAGENTSVMMTTHIQEEIEQKMDLQAVMEDGKLISFSEAGMEMGDGA